MMKPFLPLCMCSGANSPLSQTHMHTIFKVSARSHIPQPIINVLSNQAWKSFENCSAMKGGRSLTLILSNLTIGKRENGNQTIFKLENS